MPGTAPPSSGLGRHPPRVPRASGRHLLSEVTFAHSLLSFCLAPNGVGVEQGLPLVHQQRKHRGHWSWSRWGGSRQAVPSPPWCQQEEPLGRAQSNEGHVAGVCSAVDSQGRFSEHRPPLYLGHVRACVGVHISILTERRCFPGEGGL